MSTLEVKIVKVFPQPVLDTERLSTVQIEGYTAIVGRDQFNVAGDLAIFIPYDSVVPENIRAWLKEKSKIEVHGGRIRCSKIRGIFSDGLCLRPDDWLKPEDIVEGKDVKDLLGIVKYEPPPPSNSFAGVKTKGIDRHYQNENFKRYTDIDNIKKNIHEFREGEEVLATIKFHGRNARFGYVDRPTKSFSIWERIKRMVGFKVEAREQLVGSHDVIRKPGKHAKEVVDHFHKVNDKYKLTEMAKWISSMYLPSENPDVIIFCELIGSGIQKGYEYGCEEGDFNVRVFDIMIDGKYQNWDDVVAWCSLCSLPIADVVYRGPWSLDVLKLAEGVDEYNGKKYVREGIVIKPTHERKDRHNGRAIYKAINPAYLLDKTNSDFH